VLQRRTDNQSSSRIAEPQHAYPEARNCYYKAQVSATALISRSAIFLLKYY